MWTEALIFCNTQLLEGEELGPGPDSSVKPFLRYPVSCFLYEFRGKNQIVFLPHRASYWGLRNEGVPIYLRPHCPCECGRAQPGGWHTCGQRPLPL